MPIFSLGLHHLRINRDITKVLNKSEDENKKKIPVCKQLLTALHRVV